MMLTEQGAIPAQDLPVAAFRDHLRLGTGFADDALQDGVLVGFLRAAIAAIEARTGKALLEREFLWKVTRGGGAQSLTLPLAPVSAIVRLSVVDADGVAGDVDPASYRLVPDAYSPCVLSLAGPFAAAPTGGLTEVVFLAGYGPEWSDLPPDLAQAAMMLATHYYEYRHDTGLGAGCMPFGVSSLIERHRTVRMGLGR